MPTPRNTEKRKNTIKCLLNDKNLNCENLIHIYESAIKSCLEDSINDFKVIFFKFKFL